MTPGGFEGDSVGAEEGEQDGVADGSLDGSSDGCEDGSMLGTYEGIDEGSKLGSSEGIDEGSELGSSEGIDEGDELGSQSFAQNGPKSACTGLLVNAQSVPVKMSGELSYGKSTFHEQRFLLNELAPLNISYMLITEEISQFDRSPLNEVASVNT